MLAPAGFANSPDAAVQRSGGPPADGAALGPASAEAHPWLDRPIAPAGDRDGCSGAELSAPGGELLSAADLLAWRRRLLQGGGRSVDLDWLLDLAGGIPWPELQRLWLQPLRQVWLQGGRSALEALWHAHCQGAGPLQYLVGRSPWRDLELRVGPGVLIPRPETELLVELLLDAHRGDRVDRPADALPPLAAPLLWADLGTGSGCLAIALARAFPASRGLGVELSAVALSQARRNLEAHRLSERVSLLHGSWWDPLTPWWGRLELVVANPPYIPSAVVARLDPVVRDHEPRLALDGGSDGLACLRAIVAAAPRALAPGGLLLVEHHHDQSPSVLALMEAAGLHHPRAHRDIEGVPRFASAARPLSSAGARPGTEASAPQGPEPPLGRTALAGAGRPGLPGGD